MKLSTNYLYRSDMVSRCAAYLSFTPVGSDGNICTHPASLSSISIPDCTKMIARMRSDFYFTLNSSDEYQILRSIKISKHSVAIANGSDMVSGLTANLNLATNDF
jgi:hypothetical protein